MGYNIYSLRERGGSDVTEFKKAAKMAKEGIEMMCELAEEMADQFGERRGGGYGSREGYGSRGGYGRRDDEYEEFSERRMRDSRGRYM